MNRPRITLLACVAAGFLAIAGCSTHGHPVAADANTAPTSPSQPAPTSQPSTQQLRAMLLDPDDLAPLTNSAWQDVPGLSSDDGSKLGCEALDRYTGGGSGDLPSAQIALRSSRGDLFAEFVAYVPRAGKAIQEIESAIGKCPTITLDGDTLQVSAIPASGVGDASTGLKAGRNNRYVTALFVATGNYLVAMVFSDRGYAQTYYTALERAAVQEIHRPSQSESTPTPSAGLVSPLKFGETYYGNHGTITVSEPESYDPSDAAAVPANAERAIIVTITVQNTSNGVLDGYAWSYEVSSAGKSGDQITDIDVAGGPTEPPDILPGKTGTWRVAFGLPTADTAEVTIAVIWGIAEPIYWRGQA